MPDAGPALASLRARATRARDRDSLARGVVAVVHAALPQSGWTGIYWLHDDALVIGPYLGPPTEHAIIAVGQGVCGTAIKEDRDQIVPDVRDVPNYLACSAKTRSEAVVLIRKNGRVVGQIDMDSDEVGGFSVADHMFLRAVADCFAELLS